MPQIKVSPKRRAPKPKQTPKPKRIPKVKRPRGRPERIIPFGCYDEEGFFNAVRAWFSTEELSIFKTADERLRTLSSDMRVPSRDMRTPPREKHKCALYPKDDQVIKRVVDKVKSSIIRVGFIQECLGMTATEYNTFIRYIKMDSAGDNSILAVKGYAVVPYFKDRYEIEEGKLAKKSGTTDKGVTFEQFKELIKIAIYDWEALLDKFQKSRKKPKCMTQ